jgi:hypothetical protein
MRAPHDEPPHADRFSLGRVPLEPGEVLQKRRRTDTSIGAGSVGNEDGQTAAAAPSTQTAGMPNRIASTATLECHVTTAAAPAMTLSIGPSDASGTFAGTGASCCFRRYRTSRPCARASAIIRDSQISIWVSPVLHARLTSQTGDDHRATAVPEVGGRDTVSDEAIGRPVISHHPRLWMRGVNRDSELRLSVPVRQVEADHMTAIHLLQTHRLEPRRMPWPPHGEQLPTSPR